MYIVVTPRAFRPFLPSPTTLPAMLRRRFLITTAFRDLSVVDSSFRCFPLNAFRQGTVDSERALSRTPRNWRDPIGQPGSTPASYCMRRMPSRWYSTKAIVQSPTLDVSFRLARDLGDPFFIRRDRPYRKKSKSLS